MFDVNYDNINDVVSNKVNKKYVDVKANIGTNSTINVYNYKLNININDKGINNIAAALSSAWGATAGLKTAQYICGPPPTKFMVGLATMAIVQAGTSVMSKILNQGNYNNDISNF